MDKEWDKVVKYGDAHCDGWCDAIKVVEGIVEKGIMIHKEIIDTHDVLPLAYHEGCIEENQRLLEKLNKLK